MCHKRKTIAILVSVAFLLCWTIASTQAIPLTNKFNRHNLSSSADDSHPHAKAVADGGTDQICIFCHTPHSATPESTLWSRPEPETETFDMYAGRLAIKEFPDKTLYNSTDPGVQYPNGASRMCMSCHDGATAIGTVTTLAAEIEMLGGERFVTGSAIIDLSRSHPISFVWDSDVRTEVKNWHTVNATGSDYTLDPPDYNVARLDANSRMQCTTCHDPHEDPSRDTNGDPVVAPDDFPPFWRHASNCTPSTNSENCYENVCSQCHVGATPDISFPAPEPLHNTTNLVTPY